MVVPLYRNLTPHVVRVFGPEPDRRVLLEVPPDPVGPVRIQVIRRELEPLGGGIPLARTLERPDMLQLPDPQVGVFLIVSTHVLWAAARLGDRRADLLAPDGVIKKGGRPIGCTGFACTARTISPPLAAGGDG